MHGLDHLAESPLSGKRIIVVGAGIAGLSFTLSLKQLWKNELGRFPDLVHYERESGQNDRSRIGYSVSLRSDPLSPGVQTLHKMGMLATLLDTSIVREGKTRGYLGLRSLTWRTFIKVRDKAPDGVSVSGMRIARSKLRHVLLKATAEHSTVIWGVTCHRVNSLASGKIQIWLSDGSQEVCDFLVVADGANSKIRAWIRPHDHLSFSGAVSICATSHFSDRPPHPICRDWGIVPSGQGVALFTAPIDAQSAFWSLSYIADMPREQYRSGTELLWEAKERGSIFTEPFQTLVEHSDPNTCMILNAMDKQPFAHTADSGLPKNVFFIGDSNHAISQFAGAGANMALLDGYDLAECFCTYDSIERAIEEYDRRSMPRASIAVRHARFVIALVHSTGWLWLVSHCVLFLGGKALSIWNTVVALIRLLFNYW